MNRLISIEQIDDKKIIHGISIKFKSGTKKKTDYHKLLSKRKTIG
jgi:hypothetical protein